MRRRTNPSVQQPAVTHREMLLRPPTKTALEKVKDFIWDSKNKTCLTRTPMNWLSISTYYLIFIAGIIAIFAISLSVAYYITLQENRPQYVLEESPIGNTPALNFFPKNGSLPLLWLSSSCPFEHYIDNIKNILKGSEKDSKRFDLKALGDCAEAPYGYNMSPCVYIRMNRVIMWEPKPYKRGDEFPEEMPEYIKTSIKNSSEPKIWLSCEGSTAKDRDLINETAIEIQGSKAFETSSFPYLKQDDYVDPTLAIKLNMESIPKKIIMTFTCRYWARGIKNKTSAVDVNIYFE